MFEYKATVENVVDGDTVDAIIDLGFKVKIKQRLRLARVDTPERGQDKYQDAKDFTASMVLNKQVMMRTHKVSKWGYYLVDIIIDGRDLSDALIAVSLGKPYSGGAKQ